MHGNRSTNVVCMLSPPPGDREPTCMYAKCAAADLPAGEPPQLNSVSQIGNPYFVRLFRKVFNPAMVHPSEGRGASRNGKCASRLQSRRTHSSGSRQNRNGSSGHTGKKRRPTTEFRPVARRTSRAYNGEHAANTTHIRAARAAGHNRRRAQQESVLLRRRLHAGPQCSRCSRRHVGLGRHVRLVKTKESNGAGKYPGHWHRPRAPHHRDIGSCVARGG